MAPPRRRKTLARFDAGNRLQHLAGVVALAPAWKILPIRSRGLHLAFRFEPPRDNSRVVDKTLRYRIREGLHVIHLESVQTSLELHLYTTELLARAAEFPSTGARYWVFILREADLSGCGGPMQELTS